MVYWQSPSSAQWKPGAMPTLVVWVVFFMEILRIMASYKSRNYSKTKKIHWSVNLGVGMRQSKLRRRWFWEKWQWQQPSSMRPTGSELLGPESPRCEKHAFNFSLNFIFLYLKKKVCCFNFNLIWTPMIMLWKRAEKSCDTERPRKENVPPPPSQPWIPLAGGRGWTGDSWGSSMSLTTSIRR